MKRPAIFLLALSVIFVESRPDAYHVPRPLDELIRERETRATSPSAVLLIPEISALWDHEDPEAVLAAIRAITDDRRTPPWIAGYVRWVGASLLQRLGRNDEAMQHFEELDFIQQWLVVGPFDNDNEAGFERAFPPEESLNQALDTEASYPGRLRRVRWREYPAPAPPNGATVLGAIMDPAESSCAYLTTVVEARARTRAALRIGVDGATRIWLNGIEVYSDSGDRSAVPDRDATGVVLQRGRNRLTVKSCTTQGAWELFIRLTRPDGRRLTGFTVSTIPAAVSAIPPRGSAPFAVPSMWSHFWGQVGGEPDTETSESAETVVSEDVPAQAWADLARFLVLFGGDDPSEHRARDAAEAAVAVEETVNNLRLLARLHPDRNERLAALRRAEAMEPRNIYVLMALAGETRAGHHPEDVARYFERAEAVDPENLSVALARADMLDAFGLTRTALARVQPLLERQPRGRIISVVRSLAHEAGNAELEHEMALRYFETNKNSSSLRIELARYQAEHGDFERAAALLREGLTYAPLSTALRSELATVLESTGDVDGALELRRQTLALRPHDGRLHEELAHFLDRQGQDEQAQQMARRSLELRPENPWLRQWLSVVSREERFEEPYVEEPQTFLTRRGVGEGHDVRTLLDLQVRKVHQSGQSDQFRQIVFEAVTLQGARDLSQYQVAFTPHRQRLRIERTRIYRPDGSTREAVGRSTRDVYDPSIRMYYDLRATTISFGDVQPGDVVEIRYRISDVGDSNELGDYFGEMTLFQTFNPQARVAYVLLAPSDRTLVINEPEMEHLRHTVREHNGEVEHVFEALNMPAIASEPGMPPLAELAPLLLISSFQSWEELGRWYWNLVRDQLELDASQRARAEELARGHANDLEIVRAIHRHVVQSVRYVALEFGVHRFKPYRVSDIERRGFGDCKDQASLMIAMLRHVGVNAEIVLLRTRRLGRIENNPPSLEAFNHAIVYVPSLDLYIDPTAERVAVGDLPNGDQGVLVLRVSEDDVTLATTPLIEAQRQTREIRMQLTLNQAGEARGRLVMNTTGWIAGMTRSTLDDPANRVNYLERFLSSYMRGIRVSNVTTADLTELDADSAATMDIEVPSFARRENGGISFAMSIAPPLSTVVSLPSREQDLVFGPPIGWVEEINIRIPQGMRPAVLPELVEIESPMASFRLGITQQSDGSLALRSTLWWRAERVTPEQYPQLREFVEQVTAARTARVRLVSQ